MIVCITSMEGNLDSELDSRFGRCNYFIIYDTESKNIVKVINNNGGPDSGAGVAAVSLMQENNVELVLTAHLGDKAERALSLAGIKYKTGLSGKVRDLLENEQ